MTDLLSYLPYLLLPLGFVLLVKGADFLVDGASGFARRFGIPELIIGLTIVALGTSMPELVVNVVSSLAGNSGIAFGNVVGSNIANLALVLGAAAIVAPLTFHAPIIWRDVPFSLGGVVAMFVLATSVGDDRVLGPLAGIGFIATFGVFLYLLYRHVKKGDVEFEADEPHDHHLTPVRATLAIIGGLIGLILGGKLVVDNATVIAQQFGVSDALIGLTVVAVGTSLPELVTSVVAAMRGKLGLAIGNAIGSNIFNIFWVLGLSAVINPVVYASRMAVDLGILVGITLATVGLPFLTKKRMLVRWHGVLLLIGYAVYTGFVIMRG